MTVRTATPDDMSAVLALIRELATFEREPDAVEITAQTLVDHGTGDRPLFTCFVAEEDKQLLGIALCYFRFSTWVGKAVHLEDLIVSEAHRGRGIGSLLYRRVMEFARAEGARRVAWEVLEWNAPAITFYENSGARIMRDWHPVQMSVDGLTTFLARKSARG